MSQIVSPAEITSSRKRLALIALILGGVAIGASPIFVRLSEVGPMATAFWRLALALMPFLLISAMSKQGETRRPERLADYLQLMLPGLFLAVDLAAWHLSIDFTTVANATLLANLAPVFVTLIGWLAFRTRVSRIFLIGLGVAIAGVVVLKCGIAGFEVGDPRGDAVAVVAAVFYAGYILAIGRLRGRFDTLRVMIWSTASAALTILPVAFFMEANIVPASINGWAMVVGLALICHAGGQAAITYALAYLPPAFSSLTLLLQPVVAAILGVAILSEAIGLNQAIGGAIVLAGILVARRGS